MIAMRPILEQDVLDNINNERFKQPLQGYVIMDGPTYLGYALFTVENGVTLILDTDLKDKIFVDGAVRACVAAGQNKGAELFNVNTKIDALKDWWHIFGHDAQEPVNVDTIFNMC